MESRRQTHGNARLAAPGDDMAVEHAERLAQLSFAGEDANDQDDDRIVCGPMNENMGTDYRDFFIFQVILTSNYICIMSWRFCCVWNIELEFVRRTQ